MQIQQSMNELDQLLVITLLHAETAHRPLYIIRDHSFPRITEFRAEPQNLPVSTEFLCFPGILQNLALASDNGTNNATFWSVSGGRR